MAEFFKFQTRGKGVGVLIITNQVATSKSRWIHAQCTRTFIDNALGQSHRNGVPHRTVLAGHIFVGEQHFELGTVGFVSVRSTGEVDHLIAFNATGSGINRIGTNACQII